jgi:hypothetical protein
MNKYPSQEPLWQTVSAQEGQEIHDVVPPMFRIGEDNVEVMVDGRRVMSWMLTGNEDQLAPIAGWDVLPHTFEGNEGFLEIPLDARNAVSVFSGKEAWNGEKATIVAFAAEYLTRVKQELGIVDTSFIWSSVGVSSEETFVAPPNLAVSDTSVDMWKAKTANNLEILLEGDDQNKNLPEDFRKVLHDL